MVACIFNIFAHVNKQATFTIFFIFLSITFGYNIDINIECPYLDCSAMSGCCVDAVGRNAYVKMYA